MRWLRKLIFCTILGVHSYKIQKWLSVDDRYDPMCLSYTQKKCRHCNFGITTDELSRTIRRGKIKIR
jgi:hypothetical protein